jgi:hypothetical protein
VFYKDKLLKMMSKIALQTKQTLVNWRDNHASTGVPLNIANSLSLLMASNILACIFGEDVSNRSLLYKENS